MLFLAGTPTLIFLGGGIGIWLWNRDTGWYLHQWGVREVRRGRWTQLHYDDVETMTWKVTRVFINGGYAGTLHQVSLRSAREGQPTVNFTHSHRETGVSSIYRDAPNEIENICNGIARTIAGRMAERLERGEEVKWTNGLRLHRGGIRVFNSSKNWEDVPWERVARVDITEGAFNLWVEGEARSKARASTAWPNFHAGYLLVVMRLRGQHLPAKPAESARRAADGETARASGGGPGLVLEYANSIEDHVALARYLDRATPEGRAAMRVRIWVPVGIWTGLFLLACAARYWHGRTDVGGLLLSLAATLAGGALLVFVLKFGLPRLDRVRLARELKTLHEQARQGKRADPFAPLHVALDETGYGVRDCLGEGRFAWKDLSRVAWFNGYIFTFVAGDKVTRESIGLMVPPRLFEQKENARTLFETIQGWHTRACGGPTEKA
ncbi:MAG TPA: hypothetical protein VH643_10355 [Gemmataceae bacterium]|jgi:hypothetical protein